MDGRTRPATESNSYNEESNPCALFAATALARVLQRERVTNEDPMAEVDPTWMNRSCRTPQEIDICLKRPQSTAVTTLLNLVQTIQEYTESDDEVVAIIAKLINSGRVVLCGIFAGARVRIADASGSVH
jgi:hypothetical protein